MTAPELPNRTSSLGVPADEHGSAALGGEVSVDHPGQDGLASTGTLSLRTSYWAMAFLFLLTSTRVELDGQSWKLPWGHLRLSVPTGRHRLGVSFRYLGKDRGAATKEIDVEADHTVEIRYRAPWLVFLPGALRVVSDRERLPDEGAPIELTAPAPSEAAAGWYPDPIDAHQRRWWDGERWTERSLHPQTTRYKVGVALLGLTTMVLGVVGGSAIGGMLGGGADNLSESTAWVTVSDMEGVQFDMPGQPQAMTETIQGTDITIDVYVLEFDDLAMSAASVASQVPGDNRTDAQILSDSAAGAAAASSATIVDARDVLVDGRPGLDMKATSTQDGGLIMLSRTAIAGDLLVIVQTVFADDDGDAAVTAHNRMAESITFTN